MDSSKIREVALELTWQHMNVIAIEYMGIELDELDKIWVESKKKISAYCQAVITFWKRKIEDPDAPELDITQILADILYDSKLMYGEKIKECLGKERSETVSEPKEGRTQKLGEIAKIIEADDMDTMALLYMGFTDPEIKRIKSNADSDPWWNNLRILVAHSKKPDTNLATLREILKKAAKEHSLVDVHDVVNILKDDSNERSNLTRSNVPGVSVPPPPPLPGTAPSRPTVYSGTDTTDHSRSSWAGSNLHHPYRPKQDYNAQCLKYPFGKVLDSLPTDFWWLEFDKIRKRTSEILQTPEFSKTSPVNVLVIDSGMREDHPEFKNKILTKESRCFVQGDQSRRDLTLDMANHGTMVAGIIVLNGPEDVRIINFKFIPVPGHEATGHELRDALRGVRRLDGTKEEVHIINMSLAGLDETEEERDILKELSSNKILIAGAGNEGQNDDKSVRFPGNHPNVICVASCDRNGELAAHSSRGPEVAFLCPGCNIVSTRNVFGYFASDGTSFATPYATAAAAHILVTMETKKGPDYRKKLCNTMTMKNILMKMKDDETGVLQPYESLRNPNGLKDICDKCLPRRD